MRDAHVATPIPFAANKTNSAARHRIRVADAREVASRSGAWGDIEFDNAGSTRNRTGVFARSLSAATSGLACGARHEGTDCREHENDE